MKRHLFVCMAGIVLVALTSGCGGGSAGPAGPVIDSVEGNGATPDKIQDAIIVKGSGFVAGDTVEVRDAAGRPLSTGVIDTTMVSATELNLNIDPGMFKTGDCQVVVKRSGKVVAEAVGPSTFLIVGPAGPQGIQGLQGDIGLQGLKGDPGDPAPVYTAGTGIVVDNGVHTISADFGTAAGTVAEGNHDHAGVYSPVAHDHDARYYTETEINTLLTGKSDTGHNHDGRYYTETQTDTLLLGKSDVGHNHDGRYYTEAEIDTLLTGKSDTGHNHDTAYSQLGHNHDAAYINDGAGEINAANDFNFASLTFISNLDADAVDGKHASAFMDLASYDSSPDGIVDRAEYADTAGDADTVDGKHAAGFWQLTGNTGTTPGTNFIGTTDNTALELKVNGARALRLEPNSTSPNIIGGCGGNSVVPGTIGATIGGGGYAPGNENSITMDFGTVGGGMANNVYGEASTIGGGYYNIVYGGLASTIGGGYLNWTSGNTPVGGNYATVAGGYSNGADGDYATVGGGWQCLAEGDLSTVAGGSANEASGICATIGGGEGNIVGGDYSAVSGGAGNTAANSFATVGGGQVNTAGGYSSVIAGGWDNLINDWAYSVIGGGLENVVDAEIATIAGGGANLANGPGAAIGGGSWHLASGRAATIPGGDCNTALGDWSFAAGYWAQANHMGSFVWCDTDPVNNWPFASTAVNQFSARAKGGFRFVTDVDAGTGAPTKGLTIPSSSNTLRFIGTEPVEINIGLFSVLRLEHSAWGSNIIVGEGNIVWTGVVGGTIAGGGGAGGPNIVTADHATIGGGYGNLASGIESTVGGGGENYARGAVSTIAGGGVNEANGVWSTVGGGSSNHALGEYATVPGGRLNEAVGNHSFAAGYSAYANEDGTFVWADSSKPGVPVTSNGANSFVAKAAGGIWFYSDVDATTGVNLATGSGSWTTLSDMNMKENFVQIDSEDILAKVAAIPVSTWNYKSQDASIRHMGPTAQDFKATFGLGESDTGISTVDIDGVNLAAIKALAQRTTELKTANEALQKENEALKARLAAIEAKLGITVEQK